jgi:hypothetical protein
VKEKILNKEGISGDPRGIEIEDGEMISETPIGK